VPAEQSQPAASDSGTGGASGGALLEQQQTESDSDDDLMHTEDFDDAKTQQIMVRAWPAQRAKHCTGRL
jgi:hypothetical protein